MARGAVRAARLLRSARRPLIVAGGGVIYSEATAALAAFAGRHDVPVACTQAGKGALRWDHPCDVGPVGANGGSAANALAADADVVLAVGTRLSDFTTASMTAFQRPGVRFVGLNVTAADDAIKLAEVGPVGQGHFAHRADNEFDGFETGLCHHPLLRS